MDKKTRKQLEKKLWVKSGKDYRSTLGGTGKYILVWSGQGTTLKALEDFSDDELASRFSV